MRSAAALSLLALAFLLPERSPAAAAPAADFSARIKQTLAGAKALPEFYESVKRMHEPPASALQVEQSLLQIASSPAESDRLRWVSLFSLAQLQGKRSYQALRTFLRHDHWMMRDAALKSAAALRAEELAADIAPLLFDKALIVRTTAVDVVGHLKLTMLAPKLVRALSENDNYHGGRGLWIHAHILQVLKDFNYRKATPELARLLEKQAAQDSKLQAQIIGTLEHLTQQRFPGKPLPEQVYLWKRYTLSEAVF